MDYEFMITGTPLPPCMPLPKAALRLPISNIAKVLYALLLDTLQMAGMEDSNGILFICFPIVELSEELCRSSMTVKRSLNELEEAGLIRRVRQGFGRTQRDICAYPQTRGDSRL